MAIINTNTLALVSQNNLAKSQGALGQAIERLSSGLRINSAKDDAAGQAIANRFTANVNGLTQAARNANDGISIAQTTEGAINEINENLQRIRTLSVQAANGSNSSSDLRSIQAEIQERLDEIDRVSLETQFNGKYVLGVDGGSLDIQVGAHDGEQITINLRTINTERLNVDGFSVVRGIDVDNIASTAVANGDTIDGPMVNTDMTGFTAPAVSNGGAQGAVTGNLQKAGSNYYVELAGYTSGDASKNGYYEVTVAADGGLTLGNKAGTQPSASTLTSVTQVPTQVSVDLTTLASGEALHAYSGDAGDPTYVVVQGTGDDAKYFEASINDDGTVVKGAEIATGEATANPLATLDRALQQVDDLRSHLGAIQNRFESTIANLSNTVNNLSAARSRIEDADYAVEVSNMTRAQILQQAGTSVLAQANQVPQTALSLLR